MPECDVAVIGAGPYGLSAAAHLAQVKGLRVHVFGRPMAFWAENMPVGMLLRSNWTATRIADPNRSLTLEAFQSASGQRFTVPVPVGNFVDYGRWFQRQAVPDLDPRAILSVDLDPQGFRLIPEGGEPITARRVVVAVGIKEFASCPPQFDGIDPSLASHTSEHRDFGTFSGRDVLVVGSGQSALESAALLNEAGARVEVVSRSLRIHWLQGALSKTLHFRLGALTRNLLYAPTDVGPAGISQLMARPDLLRLFPRPLKDALRRRCVRPAGARWLVNRLAGVPIRLGVAVASAAPTGGKVRVALDDGSARAFDHVFLGTGYRVDISRCKILSSNILRSIDRVGGYPRLRAGLETSVPGLHVLGAPAAWSFGPLMQFVSGTQYASRALVRSVARANGLAQHDVPHGT